MKLKSILLMLVLSLSVILAACSGSAKSTDGKDEEIVLRFPHIVETDNPAHKAIELFKEEVEKESNGRIKVKIFPNAELYGSDREIIEALQLGNVEVSLVGTPSLGSFDKKFFVLDLPYIFDSKANAKKALSGELGDKLSASLEDINLKVMGYGHDSMRHILNNKKPIESPADLKGIKLRVQESEIQQDIFKAFGANPSPLSFGELYTSLQQNTFDGMDSTFSLIDSGKFYDVQKHISLTGHSYSGTITMMSKGVFDKIPADLQEVVLSAGKNMEESYYELIDNSEEESFAKFKKENLLEINELTPEGHQEFVDASKSVYEKYSEIIGEDLIQLAKDSNK